GRQYTIQLVFIIARGPRCLAVPLETLQVRGHVVAKTIRRSTLDVHHAAARQMIEAVAPYGDDGDSRCARSARAVRGAQYLESRLEVVITVDLFRGDHRHVRQVLGRGGDVAGDAPGGAEV